MQGDVKGPLVVVEAGVGAMSWFQPALITHRHWLSLAAPRILSYQDGSSLPAGHPV